MTSPESPVAIGSTVADKYRIDRVLGVGGMGIVVKATHLQLGEPVALKFVLPEHVKNEILLGRFLREARAAVRIKSEHVARVLDVDTLPGGAPYIVMEFLEGHSLEERLAKSGPLPFGEAVELVLQSLHAIGEAHSLGIVHRDLKPANLFLTVRPDGSAFVKVLDFGISKVVDPGENTVPSSLTTDSQLLGSPFFMSPEQLVSATDVDARSDIWALGAILFQLMTGVPPFVADSLPQVCAAILSGRIPSLRSHRPEVPEALDAVVARCLAQDRALRYEDVGQLASALAPFATRDVTQTVERIHRVMEHQRRISVVTAPMAALPTASNITPHMPPLPPAGPRRAKVIMALAAALVVVGTAAWFMRGTPRSTLPVSASVPAVPARPTVVLQPAQAPTSTAVPEKALPLANPTTAKPAPDTRPRPPHDRTPVTRPRNPLDMTIK